MLNDRVYELENKAKLCNLKIDGLKEKTNENVVHSILNPWVRLVNKRILSPLSRSVNTKQTT